MKNIKIDDSKVIVDSGKPQKGGHKIVIAVLLVLIIALVLLLGYYFLNTVKCGNCGERYMNGSDKTSIEINGMCEKCWDEYIKQNTDTQSETDSVNDDWNHTYEQWLLGDSTDTQ